MFFLLCFINLSEADRNTFVGNQEKSEDYAIQTVTAQIEPLFLDQKNLETLVDETREDREMSGKNAVKVTKIGKKRCRKYGYKNCVTYQHINSRVFKENIKQIEFPNGEKVNIPIISLTLFFF